MTRAAGPAGRRLASFSVPSVPGNERLALTQVAAAVAGEGIAGRRLERLGTAVTEAIMNAIEHGNGGDPGIAVGVEVLRAGPDILVAVTDSGGGHRPPGRAPGEPDLARKLAGEQDPRGWGLFLIRHMVDAVRVTTDGPLHTVWLTVRADAPGDAAARPRQRNIGGEGHRGPDGRTDGE